MFSSAPQIVGHIICQIIGICCIASMGLDVTGYRPQRSNVWLVGHSVQSLNGSRGPGQPRAAFLQPGKAAGHQWSRAGQAGEGQGTPTNLPPKGGCSPGGRGGRPPLGTCPHQASQAGRRTSTVGKSQRATRPHSKQQQPSTKQFLPRDFLFGLELFIHLRGKTSHLQHRS